MSKQEAHAITDQSTVTLREITRENLRQILNLKVNPEQEKFVANNAVSIAQAHFYPEVAWFRAIYADETPVGFVMLEDNQDEQSYFLWRFMIDGRFQKFGFGRQAIQAVKAYVQIRPGATEWLTSCVPGGGSPCSFYEKMGFRYTGEKEGNELVMRMEI